jgi:hypothetical protein
VQNFTTFWEPEKLQSLLPQDFRKQERRLEERLAPVTNCQLLIRPLQSLLLDLKGQQCQTGAETADNLKLRFKS